MSDSSPGLNLRLSLDNLSFSTNNPIVTAPHTAAYHAHQELSENPTTIVPSQHADHQPATQIMAFQRADPSRLFRTECIGKMFQIGC